MSNMFLTSDTHFGHDKIRIYCNRPYSSLEEMDEMIIQNWNSVVRKNDYVYHLGDFAFTKSNGHKVPYYLNRLNGKIHLIQGNHDYIKNDDYSGFQRISDYHKLKYNKNKIILSHYALRVWDQSHYGSLHCYGHSHGLLPGIMRSMDVGVDTNNFFPYDLEEIIAKLNAIPIPELEERE